MSNEKQVRRYSILIIAISLAIIFVINLVIPIVKALNKPPIVSITTAPIHAIAVINGKEYRNGIYTDIAPGKYTATIKSPNFDDKEINFEVKNHQNKQVLTYLNHQEEGLKYFERSHDDIDTLRKIDSDEIKSFITKYDQKLKIKSDLPAKYGYQDTDPNAEPGRNNFAELTIDDGSQDPKCKYDFCLRIRYDGTREDAAKAKIKEVLKSYPFKEEEYHSIYEKI